MSDSAKEYAEDSPPATVQKREAPTSDTTDISVPIQEGGPPEEKKGKKASTGKNLKVVQREIAEKKGVAQAELVMPTNAELLATTPGCGVGKGGKRKSSNPK